MYTHSRQRRRVATTLTALALTALAGSAVALDRTPSPAGAKVYFIGLKNGETVHSPLLLRFGLSGMGIAPAGIVLDNTGHHHLFIDTPLPADASQPVPAVEGKVLHFGKGQTEATITLTPGKHTLQLELADAKHVAHDPAVVSDVITVNVVP